MKSLYDREGLQTKESQEFGIKIEKAVKPVLEEYLKKRFSIRDLSHEAQSIIKDCELGHMIDIHMEKAKKAKKNLEKKKLNVEVKKKYGKE